MKKQNKNLKLISMLTLELVFVIVFLMFFLSNVFAEIGENATVQTFLEVGNVYPEILNVSINDDAASAILVANDTQLVSCLAVVRDFNGEGDITHVQAEFFDNTASNYGDSDDNNYHYTNSSCHINTSFGSYNGYNDDAYTVLANCSFYNWYYSNPGTWNCTVQANDTVDWIDTESDTITISDLLAVGLPDSINYGEVNATYVSNESVANVTNFGNVLLNLSLSGYAVTEGDGYAMNCSLGSIGNISIEHEKYNLTETTPGALNLAAFNSAYTNLTDSPVVREFNLNYRQNDVINEAINETYWRIYVPIGVAGTCQGNIIFGAVQANE